MTYNNATKYLLNAPDELPESKPGDRLKLLWQVLGNPQRNLKYLRLAGSNGKTVCAEMVMAAYRHSDFRVGCLTMPLCDEIRENIRIQGAPLSMDDVTEIIEKIYRTVCTINKELAQPSDEDEQTAPRSELVLTKYEILLSAALLAFVEHACHFCIIESNHTPNDPTRFLPPPVSAAVCGTIPSGDRKEIQQIRSYICHGIREIVSAPQDRDAYAVISETCAAINCRLTIPTKAELKIQKLSLSGSDFIYRKKPYRLSLCGQFQITNAIVTIEILSMLARHGYALSDEQIMAGLRSVKIPCKFEVLSVLPTIIADSTHSPTAIETVCASMESFRDRIGSRIRLCLPVGELVGQYKSVLSAQGYDVHSVIAFSPMPSEDALSEEGLLLCHKPRDAARLALQDLAANDILLISGPSAFTSQIRYEILKKLGF